MKKLLLILWMLGFMQFFCFVQAADSDSPESSPWVGWRFAFTEYNSAESLNKSGDYEQALAHYIKAREHFLNIVRLFPDWNRKVVDERIKLCESRIEQARSRSNSAPAAENKRKKTVKRSSRRKTDVERYRDNDSYRNFDDRSTGNIQSGDNGSRSRLYLEMQSEIDQYRQRMRKALEEVDSLQIKLQQSEARARDIEGVLRENRLLQEKYTMLEMQYKDLLTKSNGIDRERHQAQLLSLKQANDEALKQIKLLEETVIGKDREYAQSRTEVLKYRNDVLNLSNEKRRMQREIELLRNRAAASGNVQELKDSIKKLETTLEEKEQRIKNLMELLGSSKGDGSAAVKALNDELKRLQSELDQLRKGSSVEGELRRRISDLTAAESQLQKLLAEAAEKNQRLLAELQDVRKEEFDLQQKVLKLREERDKFFDKSTLHEKESKVLAQRYSELDKRYQDRLRSDSLNQEKFVQEKQALQKKLAAAESAAKTLQDDLTRIKQENAANQKLLKESRASIIELTSQVQSAEVNKVKIKELQKAYDDLKAQFDLASKNGSRDVMSAVNRIPGLEEAIRRYEKENKLLLARVAELKKQQQAAAVVQTTKTAGTAKASVPQLTVASKQTENIVIEMPEPALEPERIAEFIADAKSAFNRGNYEIAKWGCNQVLMRDENNAESRTIMGLIYCREGKFAEAVKMLSPVVDPSQSSEEHVHALARSFIAVRNYPAALKLLEAYKARRKGRSNARMLLAEAMAWSRSGNNQKAEEAFKIVLQLDRNNAEAPYELALMLSGDKGRLDEAGRFYRLAKVNGVEQDSYLEEVLIDADKSGDSRNFLLDNVCDALERDDMISANLYMDEALKQSPDNPEVLLISNMISLLNGNNDQVIKNLQSNTDDPGKFLLALAYLNKGENVKAEALINRTARLYKNSLPGAVLSRFIRARSAVSKEAQRKLYSEFLSKLP